MSSISLPVSSVGVLLSLLTTGVILFRSLAPMVTSFCFPKRERHTHKVSPNEHAQIWLCILDVLSILSFLVQVTYQYQQHMTIFDVSTSPISAVLFWLSLTARQSCLMVILFISLLHLRLHRRISYGTMQVYLWAPSIAFSIAGAATAASLAAFDLTSLFGGIASYISIVAVVQTLLLFFILRSTLRIVRRMKRDEDTFSWLETTRRKRRQSFDTEDVQALKDRSSWMTSVEGSQRRSLSAWSFTTSNTNHIRARHAPFNSLPSTLRSATDSDGQDVIPIIPPVPPLPSPYRRTVPLDVPRNTSPSGSTNSWLTSHSGSRDTMSSFSFPPSRQSPKPAKKAVIFPTTSTTPAFPLSTLVNVTSTSTLTSDSAPPPETLSANIMGILLCLSVIWIPYIFAIPYLVLARQGRDHQLTSAGILLIISVCIPSPLFMISIAFKSPLPIALDYSFPNRETTRARPTQNSSTTLPIHANSTQLHVRGKSGSYTVVEGRRSGDIWIEKRHAVDGLSKAERTINLLNPYPKLSVLPLRDEIIDLAPPLNEPSADPRLVQGLTISDEDINEIALVQWTEQTFATEATPPSLGNEDSVTSLPMVLTAEKRPKVSTRTVRLNSLQKDLPSPPPSIPLPPVPSEHDRPVEVSIRDIGDIASEADSESQYSGYASEYHESLDGQADVPVSQDIPIPVAQALPAPDAQSTPHLRKIQRARSLRSIPSIPSISARFGSSGSGWPPQTHRSTSNITDTSTIPGNDTLGRNINSFIRAVALPKLFTSLDGHVLPPLTETIPDISEVDNRSTLQNPPTPTRPLRIRSSGVSRQKSKSRRYTPLESMSRARASRHRTHIPKDSKTLYMSRRMTKSTSSASLQDVSVYEVQPTVASAVEYMPAISRLSTILTDHAVQVRENSQGRHETHASALKLLKEGSKPKRQSPSDKENTVKVHLSPLARTNSARARSRLIQGQKLPTVVVRPPSGSEFSDARLTNLYHTQML